MHSDHRPSYAAPLIAAALCLALALAVALPPVVFDTMHVTDTTFMAMVSRWIFEGAVPGRDFNHFYGGGHEFFVALAYRLFGVSIKALDYALVLQFGLMLVLLLGAAWQRLDRVTTSGMAVILAITLFARLPFEELPQLTQLNAAHSFAYNRLGTALTLICAVVVLVPARGQGAAGLGAVIAAFAAIVALLAKATFFPLILGVLVGLILTRRWQEVVIFVVALGLIYVALDPSGQRIWTTLSYSLGSSGLGGGTGWMFTKAVRLVWAQQVQVLAFLILLGVLWAQAGRHDRTRRAKRSRDHSEERRGLRPYLVATLIFVGCFWATTVTMGPPGLTGHSSMPVMAGCALLLWSLFARDAAKRRTRASSPHAPSHTPSLATPLVVLLVAALIIPHSINIFGISAVSLRNAERAAFTEGPLAGYFARGARMRDATGKRLLLVNAPDKVVARVVQRLEAGDRDAGTDYVMLHDAVTLLQDLPGLDQIGLASDNSLGMGFALGTPRAEGFPAWLRRNSPELRPEAQPLRNVGLVILDRTGTWRYTDVIKGHMGPEFTLCRRSQIWELYSREGLCLEGASQGPEAVTN